MSLSVTTKIKITFEKKNSQLLNKLILSYILTQSVQTGLRRRSGRGDDRRGSANEVCRRRGTPAEEKSRKTPVAVATVPFKLRTAARGWSRAGRPSSSLSAAASSRAGWCTSATGGSGHAQCKHGYTAGARNRRMSACERRDVLNEFDNETNCFQAATQSKFNAVFDVLNNLYFVSVFFSVFDSL